MSFYTSFIPIERKQGPPETKSLLLVIKTFF